MGGNVTNIVTALSLADDVMVFFLRGIQSSVDF